MKIQRFTCAAIFIEIDITVNTGHDVFNHRKIDCKNLFNFKNVELVQGKR